MSAARRTSVAGALRPLLACAAVCLLWGAPAPALDAQKPFGQYIVDFWRESAGLPQKFVLTIVQASDGYVWVGTKGGLARFDGIRFVTYDDLSPGQLMESEVWAIAEDVDASLWVGTYGGGLSHLKDRRFVHYRKDDGLPSDFVTSLARGPDGGLWIGTLGGLARWKGGRFETFRTREGLPHNAVLALHVDEGGAVWVGTERGLASYADGRFADHTAAHPNGLAGPVGTIAGSSRGGLWLGLWLANRGYGVRHLKDGVLTSFTTRDGLPSDAVTSLIVDSKGTVWAGTLGGLCRYRKGRFETSASGALAVDAQRLPETASLRNIQALCTDTEGNLWVGTRFDGLARLRDALFLNVAGGEPPASGSDVVSVFEDHKGDVWLGTAGGLKRYRDGATAAFALPGGLAADAIAQEGDGSLWIGTVGGVFRLRSGRIERLDLPPLDRLSVGALLTDAGGAVWIGAKADGLYRYASGKLTHFTTRDGLLGEEVRAIATDGRGGVWVGTRDGGLSCLRDGRFSTFGPREGLASSAVHAVFVDRDDTVWVATRRGMNRIRDGRVATVTAQDGLPANFFYQILEDDRGHLWLSYGRGILRVSKEELNDVADGKARILASAISYGTEDGMKSTAMVVPGQPTAWKGRDGRLWFATDRGAVVADPANMSHNSVPPPVWIEEVKVDEALVEPRGPLDLPPGKGDLEIRYTGLSFVAPEKVHFRYRLEGFDRDWVGAGTRRVAYYTNLPPAHYRFRVTAGNKDGVWNERGASLTLSLAPHFYQTRWFYGLCGLAAALALWAGHLWHVREMKAQFAAVLSERARIARDLHDTLAQGVVGVSAQLQAVKALLVDAPQAAGEHLDLAVEMVRHTLVEVRRSVSDIRSQALEGGDLAAALSEAAKQLSATTPIRVQVTGTPRSIPKNVADHLLHIGQEALTNAVKHSAATEIQLELCFEGAKVTLKVKDDGCGFDRDRTPSEGQGHFGLVGMRERVEKLSGQLVVTSFPGRGTEIVAVVPVT